ncbi:histone-lysine N-methyltransferase NSD2-like isoform X1 [Trichogramma pretiosum]|uniref:histone-lysine N-methyltransferase NSD2-like isoform X1 n=2 Tax=Trichogramma pretiosum TaxID=7493 RepID=UPI0006C93FEA|nr:histone-lysine N-methyltransferase NSD2-like isoform X1 [Trichogramma pretiosum]
MDSPIRNGSISKTSNTSSVEEAREEQCLFNGTTNKPYSPKLLPSISRFGRTIKPKSPSTVVFDSPKNAKLPKSIKLEKTEDELHKMEDSSSVTSDSISSLDNSIVSKDESIDNEDPIKCPWHLGQVVWAKMGGYPYWPSVVTLDPVTQSYQRKGGKNRNQVHLRFCADRGRHNWVFCNNVLPFTSKSDFDKLSAEVLSDSKKRAKYGTAYIIKPSLKRYWENAITEAAALFSQSLEDRIELFKPGGEPKSFLLEIVDYQVDNQKKRKQSTTSEEEIKVKKPKTNNGELESNEKSNQKNTSKNNVNLESPLTPPSSNKDSGDEAPISQKLKLKCRSMRENNGKDGCFEVFCERNKESALELDPEASEADIKAYLMDLWKNLNEQERSKYRADYLKDVFSMDETEEDEEDTDSEADKDETTFVESESVDKSANRRSKPNRRDHSDPDDLESTDFEQVMKKNKYKEDSDEDESVEISKRPRPINFFKGIKNEKVCQLCENTGKLIRCKGPCHSYFHLTCVKPSESSTENSETDDITENEANKEVLKKIKDKVKQKKKQPKYEENLEEDFKCFDCLSGIAPPCFICHLRDGERIKCSVLICGKHYHLDCLKRWPQSQWQGDRLCCPYHVCHTCVSDNPQNGQRLSNEKIVRCVRCPSSYHTSISCLPAGSNILTGSHIVCPKHYKSSQPPTNATWCFLCDRGGSLICCDTCPMSFHLECLGIDAPDGDYICEDCETGRLPLYGEVVWVKLGNYRWWPSIICYPQEIPKNISDIAHKTGEFCVMFLGSNDYHWIHRGKVFLYQDGDAKAKNTGSKKKGETFNRAMLEAKAYHDNYVIERALDKNKDNSNLKPPPYVKLKINKPVGNVKIPEPDSMQACECDPNQPYPCSPESDCLNRLLMIECSADACPAGDKCQNQLFTKRAYPALKAMHVEERGWGLQTLEDIKAGQFIIEYVGEIIDEAEYRLRLAQKRERKNDNYYFLTIDNNRMIDAEPKGNLSRFMNHSCLPNCATQKWTVNGDTRIGLFAVRDIKPGEELTFNYNLACDGETKKPCLCGAPNCSGFIGLKAKQQSTNVAQEKKIEKTEKIKKRKNKKSHLCWNCNEKIVNPEEAHKCDQKTCGKIYHPTCIAIEDGPDQIFHCPWHFCAECFKRTSIRCSYCCNAFCQNHMEGNIQEHQPTNSFVCYKHTLEYAMFENGELGEGLMDDDDEDDSILTEETVIANSTCIEDEQLNETMPNSRCSIVEVRGGSDDDIRLTGGYDGSDVSLPSNTKTKSCLKQEKMKIDLTPDQIAAIIGVVK